MKYHIFDRPFKIYVDASNFAIGGILAQDFDTGEHPIAYCSKTLTAALSRYSTTDRELLGVLLSVRKFRYYILGRRTLILTNHCPLRHIDAIRNSSNARLCRWALQLSGYDQEIKYNPGKSHLAEDCLSRRPLNQDSKDVNTIQSGSVAR